MGPHSIGTWVASEGWEEVECGSGGWTGVDFSFSSDLALA